MRNSTERMATVVFLRVIPGMHSRKKFFVGRYWKMVLTETEKQMFFRGFLTVQEKERGRSMGDWTAYLLVCPMTFLAGIVDAAAGGGGLISMPAYLMAGLPAHLAIGTNKVSSCMGTAAATYRFWRSGFISWRQTLPCVGFALIGAWIGARMTLLLDERVFRWVMVAILPFTAGYVLKNRNLEQEREPYSARKTWMLSSLTAFGVGIYDGFYGPGTGTFLLLLFTGLAHLKLWEAAGATKVINLSTNLAALAVFLAHGTVFLPLGIAAGCSSMLGNALGAKWFAQKGGAFAKPLILAVLTLFFIRVLWEAVI